MLVLTTTHPKAQCIDLRAMFRGEFKFSWDPAYAAERGEFRRIEAPWLTRIRCRYGFIFPWGGRRLAAYTTHARGLGLNHLPCVTVVQGGPGCPDLTVTFDVDDLPAVAELMQARRPMRLTPEDRARRAERVLELVKRREMRRQAAPGATISTEVAPSYPPDEEN